MRARVFLGLPALIAVSLFSAAHAASGEYEALRGVESTDAVFDFRVGDPETALGHLNLIHAMVNDPSMAINGRKPQIAVVFIGPSVRLVSTDRSGLDRNQQKQLGAIADKISGMKQDGVAFEICMTSVPAFDVNPDSIMPEVTKVKNGWVSVVGYQQKGFALVSDF